MATKQDKYEPLFEFLRTHSGSTLIYVTVQRVVQPCRRAYSFTDSLSSKQKRWLMS
jgi:hypothetical protein